MESANKAVKAVADYVAAVAKLAKTGKTTEHSFRGDLADLLDALAPGLKAVNEPKRSECGAPDYIVQDKAGLGVFYVEAKDLGDGDLDGKKRTGHKEQFDRYKAALDTIIFTDYLEFHLYRHGQPAGVVSIADWDGAGKVTGKSAAYADLVSLVEDAAAGDPQKIDSAKRLANLMAGKARMLQSASENYLSPLATAYDKNPDGHDPHKYPLLDMMLDFRKMLMPEVGAEEFSDIFAQTITYGMFAARLNDPTPENFSRGEAMMLIPQTNPFLKQLFMYVAANMESELTWIVDDLAELFKAADVSKIMKDYGKATGGADPMVHFYEDFLREYDRALRKKRGVWYTPIQVVKFIVSAVDWALRTRFGIEDGIADDSKVEIEVEEAAAHGKKLVTKVKKAVHKVQILDPALGTGTFHAEVVRQIKERFAGNEGMWPGYVAKDLVPRLNGFELLMASYTMAHIKLGYAVGDAAASCGRFRIFLTDSLSDWHKEVPGGLFAAALGAEQEGADEVKRDIPVMVVMGNPPYSGISQNNGEWIARLMEDYKVEPGGKQRLQERKNWLNDDYVKFIRLAEHYVEKNGEGIVAYITPHGFLDNPTFRGMRWHLMQTFDEMWTLNLHGNSKKKEVAPDGGKDECVFDITQGVAITMMVKRGKTAATASVKATAVKENAKDAKIYYADLWGRRKDKLAALEGFTMESVEWQEVNPTEPMLFFVPRDTIAETEYSKGFKIEDLFLCNVMGIVTARDAFVVDIRKEDLLSRVYDFCSLSLADDVIRARYFGTKKSGKYLPGDTRGWKLGVARKKIASYNHEQVIKPVNYRPFDPRFIYYSPDMVDWGRERLMSHFLKGNNFGLCCIRICSRDDDLPVFVTDKITDKTILSSKDNANVFPLYLYEENMGKVEKRANLDKDIVAKIAAIINPVNPVNPVKETPSPEDIFDYIYGVLHSPSYRAKFREFLKSDFPRIPYPADKAEFDKFRNAGTGLREAHLMKDAAPALAEKRARFPVLGSDEVEKVEWREDVGEVWINETQHFTDVPKEAWEQAIGGYRPAEKWLKDRKGRKLTQDEIKHYQRIILALDKTSEIMNGLKE